MIRPPPIPAIEYSEDTVDDRVMRIRLTLSKTADMVFIGHLDFVRSRSGSMASLSSLSQSCNSRL